MKLELKSIEALDCVIRTGSVSRAALMLNKAQSAVSYHLKQLESQLGLTLLSREDYRLKLTPAGEVVLAEGRALLAQVRKLEGLAHEFNAGWEPRLTVIYDGILPLKALLHALKGLSDLNSATRIGLSVAFLGGVQHQFDHQDADIMLVKNYEHRADLIFEPIAEIESVLCIAPNHPLARLSSVDLKTLHEHIELTIQDSRPNQHRTIDRALFGGERVFHLSDFSAKREALIMGLGFGWLPLHMAEQDLHKRLLLELPYCGGSRYRFQPLLVSRRDKPLGPSARHFADLLRKQLIFNQN